MEPLFWKPWPTTDHWADHPTRSQMLSQYCWNDLFTPPGLSWTSHNWHWPPQRAFDTWQLSLANTYVRNWELGVSKGLSHSLLALHYQPWNLDHGPFFGAWLERWYTEILFKRTDFTDEKQTASIPIEIACGWRASLFKDVPFPFSAWSGTLDRNLRKKGRGKTMKLNSSRRDQFVVDCWPLTQTRTKMEISCQNF